MTNLSNLIINVGKNARKAIACAAYLQPRIYEPAGPASNGTYVFRLPVRSFFLAIRTLLFLAQRQGVRVKEGGKLFSSWLKISDYDYQRLKCTNEMHVRLKCSTCCRLSAIIGGGAAGLAQREAQSGARHVEHALAAVRPEKDHPAVRVQLLQGSTAGLRKRIRFSKTDFQKIVTKHHRNTLFFHNPLRYWNLSITPIKALSSSLTLFLSLAESVLHPEGRK